MSQHGIVFLWDFKSAIDGGLPPVTGVLRRSGIRLVDDGAEVVA